MATWQHHADYIRARNACEEVMIISAEDGSHYASAPATFQLRQYDGLVMQESGEEVEETINEASDVAQLIKNATTGSGPGVPHGLRLNSGKKQMMIRTFKDEETELGVIYGKFPKGGSCVASAGKVIIIGQFSELKNQTAAECNDTIQAMARYLHGSVWPDTSGGNASSANSTLASKVSWQPFCEQVLIGKGNTKECLICSKATGAVYATATLDSIQAAKAGKSGTDIQSKFTLKKYETEMPQEDGTDKLTTIDEASAIVGLMAKAPGSRPPMGLRFNQQKYQFIRGAVDDDSGCNTAHGKKIKGGCVVSCTDTLILIGTFDETLNHTSAGCSTNIADLAKYLKANGL